MTSVGGGAAIPGPSDQGLAGERTTLAWTRMGLTLLGLPSALLAFTAGHNWLAFGASVIAALLGLFVLVGSLRRQRVGPDVIPAGSMTPAGTMILVTGACTVTLAVAGAALIVV